MLRHRAGPTWGLLNPSAILNGDEAPRLLGRIVTDIDDLLSGYVPEDPREVLQLEPMEVVTYDVQQQISASSSSEVEARLTQLLGVGAACKHQHKNQLEAHRVITRILRQHHQCYKALMDRYREAIIQLLQNQPSRSGYMVVGVKSCIDGRIQAFGAENCDYNATAELPLEAIAAAFGAAIPPACTANPTITVKKQDLTGTLARFAIKGERIFSVQVREVRYRGIMRQDLRLGAIGQFEPQQATFGNSKYDRDLVLKSGSTRPPAQSGIQAEALDHATTSTEEASMSDEDDLVPEIEDPVLLTDNDQALGEATIFAELTL